MLNRRAAHLLLALLDKAGYLIGQREALAHGLLLRSHGWLRCGNRRLHMRLWARELPRGMALVLRGQRLGPCLLRLRGVWSLVLHRVALIHVHVLVLVLVLVRRSGRLDRRRNLRCGRTCAVVKGSVVGLAGL